jgi:hypothetical protein
MTEAEKRRAEGKLRENLTENFWIWSILRFPMGGGRGIARYDLVHGVQSAPLGLTMEAMGLSMDRMREEYRPTALKRVKATLILEKVARDNAVEVTQEDMENA